MKKILNVVMLLLGMSIMNSCNKENNGSTGSIIGEWSIFKIETVSLEDGSLIGTFTEKNLDGYIITDDENEYLMGPLTPMGANWPNMDALIITDKYIESFMRYGYTINDNTIIPSSEWEAKIESLTSNTLVLYIESGVDDFGVKFFLRK